MSIEELAPPDFKWVDKNDPHRCWMCGYYSFKTFSGENETTGKCFRDHKKYQKVWYVDGLTRAESKILLEHMIHTHIGKNKKNENPR